MLHEKQLQFINSKAYISALLGGRGVGKTFSGAAKVILQAKANEPWMSVSPDSGVIIDTTLPTFLDVARRYRKLVRYVKSPYPRVWFRTQDGGVADIIMRSGEKPDKLRGPNKAGLWLDEASVMTESVFEIAIATLRIKGSSNQVFMTMTPNGRHHWTFARFFEPIDEYEALEEDPGRILEINGALYRRRDDTELFQAASYANPFLPKDYAKRLLSQYSRQFAEQEVEGNFVDLAGLLFTRSDFQFMDVKDIPREAARVRYWDRAATEGGGSYTVGLLMARDSQNRFIIENVVRGQWSAGKRKEMMKKTAEVDALKYDNEVIIYVEQEGGSGGKEQMDQDVVMLAGHPVYRDIVSGTKIRRKDGIVLPGRAKVTRAAPFAAMAENQHVYLVTAKWNGPYLDEIIAFPESTHSDQVDASSGAFNKLAFRMTESEYNPEKLKSEQLQSNAARLLQMQRQQRQRRGTVPSNPREKLGRVPASSRKTQRR
jgi:predicted phage terminase large subunit-like protein